MSKARQSKVHPGNQPFFAGGLREDLLARGLRLYRIESKAMVTSGCAH
jgi:hypothetical protein